MKREDVQRFWSKVAKTGTCWEWTAGKFHFGHGAFHRGGRPYMAHRISWELANGPIPDGMNVCHRCDNPACVNPAHLFLGTQGDSMRDMVAKGRGRERKGEANGKGAKLTEQTVRQALEMRKNGSTYKQIGQELGVSRHLVSLVCRGKRWRHITEATL